MCGSGQFGREFVDEIAAIAAQDRSSSVRSFALGALGNLAEFSSSYTDFIVSQADHRCRLRNSLLSAIDSLSLGVK